jgi:hypothetical protein
VVPSRLGRDKSGFAVAMSEGNESDAKYDADVAVEAPMPEEANASTVGTGSVIGIGCILVVLAFVLLAVAYRWWGGTW